MEFQLSLSPKIQTVCFLQYLERNKAITTSPNEEFAFSCLGVVVESWEGGATWAWIGGLETGGCEGLCVDCEGEAQGEEGGEREVEHLRNGKKRKWLGNAQRGRFGKQSRASCDGLVNTSKPQLSI